MITDPWFYICAVPAVLLFGMAKGGLGGGLAMLSVPLMSLAVSPITAAAILLPILLVMDAVAVQSFWKKWSKPHLKARIPGAVVGVVVGMFTFRYLSEDWIRLLIGMISLGFCLHFWLSPKLSANSKWQGLAGPFWGSVAGFTSFGIHAGGPPISIYLLPQRLDKVTLMASFAGFFAVVNLLKVGPYIWLGQFDAQVISTALVLVPLAPIGVKLGVFLLHRIDEAWIYRLCYLALFAVGVRLSLQGAGGLLG